MDHHKKAIDILLKISQPTPFLYEIAKNNPHAIIRAHESLESFDPEPLKATIRSLLLSNQKVPAIKLWREKTGVGLKEAKQEVDKIEDSLS